MEEKKNTPKTSDSYQNDRQKQDSLKNNREETEQENASLSRDSGSTNIPLHPTGSPEATGGWFSEFDDFDQHQPEQYQPSNRRHPTGDPEQTGGWFQDSSDQAPPLNRQDSQEETRKIETVKRQAGPSQKQASTKNSHLPKRVDEMDADATQVISSAYQINQKTQKTVPVNNTKTTQFPHSFSELRQIFTRLANNNSKAGCVLQAGIILAFIGIISLLVVLTFLIFKYFSIASSLPAIDNLQEQASQFETTRILDRNGNLLYELVDPNAGRRTYIPLEDISPNLIAATIATEDQDYYTHPGFDVFAILRALLQNYISGETVSGASTITQQLARSILLSPTERTERTVDRKAREIVLAAEITRKYDKDEILELYLNEIYYGSQAYGIEAAAETYFNTSADRLTLGQASFLAGLPQAPSVYDVFANPDETFNRQRDVIILMFQLSQDKDCIEVSTNVQPVCVDATSAAEAIEEITSYHFVPHEYIMNYPHWVNYIRALLEEEYDSQTIYRSGFTINTTLDPVLQKRAEEIVNQHVTSLSANHVSDGALVAIDPANGEILTMVGSTDFYDEEISGQVNMAVSPRQPGSSIKPLTYAAAFEKGWTPATLIWDVPSEFPPSGEETDPSPRYVPVNYDDRFHGPVLLRTALANSYNIPAVKTLQFVGIYDDANIPGNDGLIDFAGRMGITTLTGEDYGLSLTLGGGDVTLLELTNAYGIFANGGRSIKPVSITKIVDYLGNTIFELQPAAGDQVIRQEHAFLINSILSDNQARTPMFGQNSVLNLSFPVAAKTGTTNNFRDNWTIGYTPDLAVGVWVGNADYTPMLNTTGLSGAAPIWSEFMKYGIEEMTGNNPAPFVRPAGIVERTICATSGTEPSEWCPQQITELFAYDQLPLPAEDDLWVKTEIDTWTGYRASEACSEYTEEKYALNIQDEWAIEWLNNSEDGRHWLEQLGLSDSLTFIPDKECTFEDARPLIEFPALTEDQWVTSSPLDIYAVINATQFFSHYQLEYGLGREPDDWYRLLEYQTAPITQPQNIYSMDVSNLPQGTITLRIVMNSTLGTFAEKRLHLNLNVPTQTPTLTPLPTETAIPSLMPTVTINVTATLSPTVTETLVP